MRALAAPLSGVGRSGEMKQEPRAARNVPPTTLALASVLGALLLSGPARAYGADPMGPPNERTGAPLEGTCADVQCHFDEPVDSGPGELVLIVPPSYVPDEVYTIDVRLAQADQMRWGFELAALDAAGTSVGSLASIDAETQVAVSNGTTEPLGRQYVKHTPLGTGAGQADAYAWSFTWTAPSSDAGPVTFYAAGNAADDNGFQFRLPGFGDAGDFIYTAQETVALPEPGVQGGAIGIAAAICLAGARHRRRIGHRCRLPLGEAVGLG